MRKEEERVSNLEAKMMQLMAKPNVDLRDQGIMIVLPALDEAMAATQLKHANQFASLIMKNFGADLVTVVADYQKVDATLSKVSVPYDWVIFFHEFSDFVRNFILERSIRQNASLKFAELY